ncbi:MAG: hypothetical protein ABI321_19010 [Polyangia bacterium]
MIGPASWEDSEPDLAFAKREIHRLVKRSRPRRMWILIIAIVSCVGFVAKRELRPPKRRAVMSLRIVESDFDLTTAVRPQRDYVDYIWGVFLSGPHLEKLIKEYGLYPEKYERDPQLAVEAMRDDLDIEVWRNYFLEQHYDDDAEARSVRFSISWEDKDPQLALSVVRALSKVIIEAQTEERREIFQVGQQDFADAAAAAAQRLDVVQHEQSIRRAQLDRAVGDKFARLTVELHDLAAVEKEQGKRLEEMSDTKSRFELEAAWEQQRSGLRFELIDPGFVEPKAGGPRQLVASVVLVFTAVCFLASMMFGAFEVKIRQPSDVRRLGVPLLGAVPSFTGDEPGSLVQRLAAADKIRLEKR